MGYDEELKKKNKDFFKISRSFAALRAASSGNDLKMRNEREREFREHTLHRKYACTRCIVRDVIEKAGH